MKRKKIEKKDSNKLVIGALLVTMLIVGASLNFIVTTDLYKNIPTSVLLNQDEQIEVEEKEKKWRLLPVTAANNSPAESGIVNVFTLDSDHGSLDYDVGIAEDDAWVYEHADAGGFQDADELAGTTPYETGFDICVCYQFTGAQAVDGGAWNISRVKAYCNSTDLSISSQVMEKSTAFFGTTGTGSSDTGKVNFYLKDNDGGGGTGFTINIDQSFTVDDIKIYYYG